MSLSTIEKSLIKKIRSSKDSTIADDALRLAVRGQISDDEYLAAINSLSRKQLINIKQTKNKKPFYHAPSAEEVKKTSTMEGDEAIVYSFIKESDNMGMWTKALKGKSGLHQTAINKCLKTLEGRGLIKTVQNIKWPTRKTYMLAEITPSVEITGGPWYTDEDLDTEFINKLMEFCEIFVRKKSFPRRVVKDKVPENFFIPNPIFPPSHSHKLPTPQAVTDFLAKSDISQTKLEVEHVMQLMAVLAYDGKIEIIRLSSKAVKSGGGEGEQGWASDLEEGGGGMDSEEERREMKEREKRRKSKKRGRDEDSDDTDSEEEERRKKKAKKAKKKKKEKEREKERRREKEREKRRKARKSRSKSRSRKGTDEDSDDDSDTLRTIDEDTHKSKKSKKRAVSSSSDSDTDSSTDSSDSDSDSSDSDKSSVSSSEIDRKDYKLNSGRDKARAAAPNGFDASMLDDDGYDLYKDKNVVYRSLRQGATHFGLTEAPCGNCPQFSFCSQAGPVNPKGCEYFRGWLEQDFAD